MKGSLGTDGEEEVDPATATVLFPSLLVLGGFPCFEVLPVGLALTALDFAEELFDESLGFCLNWRHKGYQRLHRMQNMYF